MKKARPAVAEHDRNQIDRSLLQIAETLNHSLDLETTAQRVVDYMVTGLGSSGGVLFLRDPGSEEAYAFTVSAAPIVQRALQNLPYPFRAHRYPIPEPNNLVGRCFRDARSFEGSDLVDFLSPTPATRVCRIMQRVVGAKYFAVHPVLMHREVIGATLFSFRESELSEARRLQLRIFTNLVATAVSARRGEASHKPPSLRALEDHFLDLVAHELGSPVASLRILLAVLGNDAGLRSYLKDRDTGILGNLQVEVERLRALVDNAEFVLATRRSSDADRRERVSLVELVARTANKRAVEALGSSAKVRLSLPSMARIPMEVYGNRRQLEHVVWELLSNVQKHAGPGASAFVRVRFRVDDAGRFAECTVYDDGAGIPSEVRDRMFRESFTIGEAPMNKSKPGLGLGLYVVGRLIHAHGGAIRVRSSSRFGTAVTFRLPLIDATELG